jgi:hypothetical protein
MSRVIIKNRKPAPEELVFLSLVGDVHPSIADKVSAIISQVMDAEGRESFTMADVLAAKREVLGGGDA